MTHQDAIATLTSATTTTELADAIAAFTDLRTDAAPGTAPGVPNDAPDGLYFNGFHLFSKAGQRLYATAVHELPDHTIDLWEQLDRERRDQKEEQALVAEVRRGRGRPKVGRPIPVRLPDWRIAALDRDAKAADVDRAELIRALIHAGYATIRATGPARVEAIRALVHDQPATPTAAERVMAMEHTYHVEILHPESSVWTHIHGVDWETTTSYPDAWIYGVDVARDHPGSRVRLVETDADGTRYLPIPEDA